MNTAEALARLKVMTAWDSAPTLSEIEVDYLLTMSKLADSSGRAPDNDDWDPTWDLNRGAAEGWRYKAGKIANDFDFTEAGMSAHLSQAVKHCQDMADHYRRKIVSNAILPGALATEY